MEKKKKKRSLQISRTLNATERRKRQRFSLLGFSSLLSRLVKKGKECQSKNFGGERLVLKFISSVKRDFVCVCVYRTIDRIL